MGEMNAKERYDGWLILIGFITTHPMQDKLNEEARELLLHVQNLLWEDLKKEENLKGG